MYPFDAKLESTAIPSRPRSEYEFTRLEMSRISVALVEPGCGHLQAAVLLDHEHASVRRPGRLHRVVEPAHDQPLLEVRRVLDGISRRRREGAEDQCSRSCSNCSHRSQRGRELLAVPGYRPGSTSVSQVLGYRQSFARARFPSPWA